MPNAILNGKGRSLCSISLAMCVALAGCSSEPSGGDNETAAGSSSGGGTVCTGNFCIEDNQEIATDPDKLAYTDMAVGTEQVRQLQVHNIGHRGALKISSVAFLPATGEFTVQGFAPTSLQPSQSVQWNVVYKPQKTGPRTVVLIINSNTIDSTKKPLKVPVLVKVATGQLSATPDPLDFGAVASNATVKKSTRIFNTGNKPVTIESVALAADQSPDYKLDSAPTTPFEVAPSASFDVSVAFTPSNGGNDTTHILVGYAAGQAFSVGVIGVEIGPLISAAPSEVNFGYVAVDSAQSKSFRIFSKGQTDLQVSKIELDPSSSFKGITIDQQGPLTLKPNESKVISVQLNGDKALPQKSAQVATVLVHSDAANVPTLKVPLRVAAQPCVAGKSSFSLEAKAAKGQVDIVLVIDSSKSMNQEKKAVSANLNMFASSITAKNIDHHVILIGAGICVPPPLASPGCLDSASFKHINVPVGSHDTLKKVIDTYPMWQGFLRAGAQKHFLVVTDDNSFDSAAWFQNQVTKLNNPGFPAGFVFHSIVGWAPNIVPSFGCVGAAGHGKVYIELSKKTGGELASICATQVGVPPDWSGLFKKIGDNVVSNVNVQCKYALPTSKDGKPVDPATVSLTFKETDGSTSTFKRWYGIGGCGTSKHGWYFDNNANPTAAVLCPTSCTKFNGFKMSFYYGC